MSKKAGNPEGTYPELEKQRAKLGEVMQQLKGIDQKLEEAISQKRAREARQNSIQSKAELLLIGEEVLPEKDLETEVRALLERRDIVVKAAQIQQGASMKQRGERLRRNT